MSSPVLTTEHITQMIHRCIIDLQDKSRSTRLIPELAALLHSLAQATDDPTYRVLAQPIGAFGSELSSFQTLVAVPFLQTETRERCRSMLEEAVKAGEEALEVIKSELQRSEDRDYKEIVRAVALLMEHDYRLYGERSSLTRGSGKGSPEAE